MGDRYLTRCHRRYRSIWHRSDRAEASPIPDGNASRGRGACAQLAVTRPAGWYRSPRALGCRL